MHLHVYVHVVVEAWGRGRARVRLRGILARTSHENECAALPAAAISGIGLSADKKNVLLRVLCSRTRNGLRGAIY